LKSFIIVEGLNDKWVVEQVLQKSKLLPSKASLINAHGQSAAESLGRSIVATKHSPVVLVLDADTNAPESIREKRSFLETSLRSISANVPWLVILMVPEIEVVFFRAPQTLKPLLGIVDPSLVDQGKIAPKKTLTSILQSRGLTFERFVNQRLTNTALSQLAELEEFRQLREFINDPYSHAAATDQDSAHKP
jgi:hypothetical protein